MIFKIAKDLLDLLAALTRWPNNNPADLFQQHIRWRKMIDAQLPEQLIPGPAAKVAAGRWGIEAMRLIEALWKEHTTRGAWKAEVDRAVQPIVVAIDQRCLLERVA